MRKVSTKPLLQAGLLAALLTAGVPAAGQPHRAVPRRLREALERVGDSTRRQPQAVAPLPGPAQPGPAVRYPDSRLRELRDDRDLRYVEEGAPEGESLIERFLRWLARLLSNLRGTKGGRFTTNLLFYGLAAGAVVFGVLKLLQVDFTRLFGRARKAVPLDYEASPENIHELNFDEALTQAETAGNLRLAVRLGYLQLLKQLTDRDLIDWQPDKTNQTYLRELTASRPALRPAFAELTRQFEYVWYGEWPVRPAGYRRLREAQQQLARELGGVAV